LAKNLPPGDLKGLKDKDILATQTKICKPNIGTPRNPGIKSMIWWPMYR